MSWVLFSCLDRQTNTQLKKNKIDAFALIHRLISSDYLEESQELDFMDSDNLLQQ